MREEDLGEEVEEEFAVFHKPKNKVFQEGGSRMLLSDG